MIAPAVGAPANVAKEQSVSTMPNRTPIFRVSFVRLVREETNVPWLALIASPKKALNMYMSVRVVTPVQPNTTALTDIVATMKTLMGPKKLLARYPTTGLVGTPTAFVIRSKLTESTDEKPITFRA